MRSTCCSLGFDLNGTGTFLSATLDRFQSVGNLFASSTVFETGIRRYIEKQITRCTDPEYSERFSYAANHFQLPASAFRQRMFKCQGQTFVGGVRFFGGNMDRAFVDVSIWTGEPDWAVLRNAVACEWDILKPSRLRVLMPMASDIPTAYTDQTVHVGTLSQVAGKALDADVSIRACNDPSYASAITAKAFYKLPISSLKGDLQASNEDDFRECLETGSVHIIEYRGERAGIIATQTVDLEFFYRCLIFEEEAVLPEYRSKGLARQAQTLVARHFIKQRMSPDTLLTGPIRAENIPSFKTATAAGRPAVLKYVFLDL